MAEAGGYVIEGYAIISADGMIADAAGAFPDALTNAADLARFRAALRAAAILVMGRRTHERHPPKRLRRLVLTGRVAGLEGGDDDARTVFLNPRRAALGDVLPRLGIAGGTVAVLGGTAVFDRFLPDYAAFHLSEVNGRVLPGGTPCFAAGHPRAVLAAHGLVPADRLVLDAAADVTLTGWRRPVTPAAPTPWPPTA